MDEDIDRTIKVMLEMNDEWMGKGEWMSMNWWMSVH